MPVTDRRKLLIIVLFFISGITGLIYEVAWTRMFVTVFGSTTHAMSTVLAAFMAGLALGSVILGPIGDRLNRPILTFGILQVLIGVYALLVPWIIGSLGGVYSAVFDTFGQQTFPVTALRFLLSFLVILIPTTLMGGTLPVLSKYAGREFGAIGRNIGGLYAVNTFGAVIGSFSTGFLLLELIGVSSSVYLAAVLSIAVGAVAMSAGRQAVPEPIARPAEETASGLPMPAFTAFVVLLAIGISGGAALAYEVIYAKVLIFSLGTTAHAFSLMLSTFLAGLALGSYIMSRLIDRSRRPSDLFAVVEIVIGAMALASIYLLSKLDLTHEYLAIRDAGGSLFEIRGAGFLQAALVMIVPALFMGSAFPIVTRIYTRRNLVSSSVGKIYFFNTIGAVAGSLLAGFALVPLLGSARSIAFVASFNIAAGVLLFSCEGRRRTWIGAAAASLVALIVIAVMLDPAIFAQTFNIKEPGSELLYFKEGVSGTVTVHRYPDYDLLAIDGVNVAGTSDMLRVTQKLQGHVPILLADDKQKVAHIGFGSGETLRILTLHEAHSIDGVEICKDVISVAKRFFSALNQNVFDRPDVNIVIMDGKNYVLLTEDEYDIIMTDSIYPGTGGASALYTYDHFKAVRDKLKPGGIASCWLPLDLSPEDMRVSLKAFYDVFPNMAVWYCYMTFSQHALLVGKKDEPIRIDLARFTEAFGDSTIRKDFESILIDDPFTLISCFVADGDAVRQFCGDAPRHSDDHPILEFGLARRGSAKPYLSSNLQQMLALRPNPIPYIANVTEAGLDSATVAARAAQKVIVSSNIIAGHVQNAVGETGLARARYANVFELDPENRIAEYQIASLDRTMGQLQTAADAGQGGYDVVYRLGLRYLAEGKFEEALGQLERARDLRPDLANPYVSIGECYMRWGKPKKAVEYLTRADQIKPGDGGIVMRLAMAQNMVGAKEEARQLFQRAVELDPQSYESRLYLGGTLLAEGKVKEAREHLERAQSIDPGKPYAWFNLGLSYVAETRWKEAAEHFEKATSRAPTYYPAHFQLGNALFQLGDIEGARRAWRRTLTLKPDHEEARRRLGEHPR
jgi:spermidine synthase